MRMAYVTIADSSDLHDWSGLAFYVRKAFTDSGFQIQPIGNLREGYYLLTKVKRTLYKRLFSKVYLSDREPFIQRSYSNQVAKSLAHIDCDVVFSPGSRPIANLNTKKPIVFWTDATFAGLVNFYPGFDNLCKESIRNGNRMEQLALSKCRLAMYTSEWAARTAIENYKVDPAKVRVVPFGANIDCNRDAEEIQNIFLKKKFETCKLLFIGVEWYRKGGDIAIKVAELLNQQGIPTELNVVGCTPPGAAPGFVRCHGFVSKKSEEGCKQLDTLFRESHFLILPTRAECVPVVFAEAASYGLPSLATNVGGIPTAIQNGKNGQIYSLSDTPAKYSEYIFKLFSAKQKYEQLSLSCFREYLDRLNWESARKLATNLIHAHCGEDFSRHQL